MLPLHQRHHKKANAARSLLMEEIGYHKQQMRILKAKRLWDKIFLNEAEA